MQEILVIESANKVLKKPKYIKLNTTKLCQQQLQSITKSKNTRYSKIAI